MAYRKPNADERFRKLIDDYNLNEALFKDIERERERLRKKLRNIVRRRGRGTHNGNESSINAYDVKRMILKQELVRQLLSAKDCNGCFKPSKFIQIDGGPLLPDSKVVPDLGPPHTSEE